MIKVHHSNFIFEHITKTNTNDMFVEREPFLLKATLYLLLCFNGGGWDAVFIGCFPIFLRLGLVCQMGWSSHGLLCEECEFSLFK